VVERREKKVNMARLDVDVAASRARYSGAYLVRHHINR
jgi:hypothetical protein